MAIIFTEGKVKEKQVISKDWIKESLSIQAKLDKNDVLREANGYGYYWWRRRVNKRQVYLASGMGGKLICVIPDLKTVIVTACFPNEKTGKDLK